MSADQRPTKVSELPVITSLTHAEVIGLGDGELGRISVADLVDLVPTAYDLAVANGFSGTQEEWLATLGLTAAAALAKEEVTATAALVAVQREEVGVLAGHVADDRAVAESSADIASQGAAAVTAIKAQVVALGETAGSFLTLASATSAIASIPANGAVYVTADGANNGLWVKRSGSLVQDSTATVPGLVTRIEGDEANLQTFRNRIELPLVGNYAEAVLDAAGIVIEALDTGTGERLTRRSGVLTTQVALDAAQDARLATQETDGVALPLVGTRSRAYLDVAGKILWAVDEAAGVLVPFEGSLVPEHQALATLASRAAIAAAAGLAEMPLVGDAAFAVFDSGYRTLFKIATDDRAYSRNRSGAIVALGDQTDTRVTLTSAAGSNYTSDQTLTLPPSDVDIGFVFTGQSYTFGAALGDPATPPYSTTARDPGFALMPAGGCMRFAANGPGFTAYENLRSIEVMGSTDRFVGETVMPEAANRILATMQARFGVKRRVVCFGAGQSGQRYYVIKRGTQVWTDLMTCIDSAIAVSAAAGQRFVLGAIGICHGEADYSSPPAVYARALREWQSDFQAEIRARTGQTEPVKVIFYAPMRGYGTGDVRVAYSTLAMQEVCASDPHIFALAGPAYQVEHAADNHPTIAGYRMLGDLFGQAFVEHVMGTGRRPCFVQAVRVLSSTSVQLEIAVPNGGSLVRDESNTIIGYPASTSDPSYIGPPPSGSEANGRDGGLFVRDGAGSFGVVSSTVSGNSIVVTFSRPFQPGGTSLLIGARPQNGTTGGTRADGPRTIFRGSVARTLTGISEPQYDWLTPQEIRI